MHAVLFVLVWSLVAGQQQSANVTVTTSRPPSSTTTTAACHVRLAVIAPKHMPLLNAKLGFYTSAGAIGLALDRVNNERLLPTCTFSFEVADSDCNEATATGALVEWLSQRQVDALLGPACGLAAQSAATLCKHFNVPMFSWAATTTALDNRQRYPSTVKVISTALRCGRAMRELLNYFKWTRFAFFYTDDKAARNCHSIAEGIRPAIAESPITNVFNMMVDGVTPSDQQIDMFLTSLAKTARIAIVCLEHEADSRRFMLRAQQLRMTGDEYVYILPDFVRDQNRTQLWLQYDTKERDGRDLEALQFEMLLTSNEELHYFKQQVIERIKGPPFYYDAATATEQYVSSNDHNQEGSLYSPFLHDAMYLYARALNNTLSAGQDIRNGTVVMKQSAGMQFLGASGRVFMDETAGRVPNFVLKALDGGAQLQPLLELLMTREDGKTVNLLIPERLIWQSRNYRVPASAPRCGFDNEKCQPKQSNGLFMVLLAGGLAGLLMAALIVIAVSSFVKRFMVSNEMAKMLWKLSYHELSFVSKRSSRNSSCDGSMQTVKTGTTLSSDEAAEARAKGEKQVAYLRGVLVWAKEHQASMVFSSDEDHLRMKTLRDMVHDNVNMFFGLVLDGPHPISVWAYHSKGSLDDMLHNENVKLDWFFKYALIRDLVNVGRQRHRPVKVVNMAQLLQGLDYIHATAIETHGRIRSSNCLLDTRFTLKLSDFGLPRMRTQPKEAKDKLWTAPEFLRMMEPPLEGTQAGDVFSVSIVMQEILCRDRPYCNDKLSDGDVVLRVAKAEDPPFRPTINITDPNEINPDIYDVLNDCWKEKPDFRPTSAALKKDIRKLYKGKKLNLLDHIMRMMEKYTQSLETTVSDRTKQMTDEMKRADMLLYRMIPKEIATQLKSGASVDPAEFSSVSTLTCTAPQFGSITERSTPLQCILMINDIYSMLDELICDLDVFKMESINISEYVACSGLPSPNGDQHAAIMCDVALSFVSSVQHYHILHLPNEKLTLQIGISTDRLTAGVVGSAMPRYCTFGDGINSSRFMMETGKDSCIHITDATTKLLKSAGQKFLTKPRGECTMPDGKVVTTHWLLGKANQLMHDSMTATSSAASDTDR